MSCSSGGPASRFRWPSSISRSRVERDSRSSACRSPGISCCGSRTTQATRRARSFSIRSTAAAGSTIARCRALLHQHVGEDAAFDRTLLDPCTSRQILGRMLNNLKRTYVELRSYPHARAVTELLLTVGFRDSAPIFATVASSRITSTTIRRRSAISNATFGYTPGRTTTATSGPRGGTCEDAPRTSRWARTELRVPRSSVPGSGFWFMVQGAWF